MKGPSERLKYDFRRVWECPACGRKERTSGAVTFRYCRCQSDVPLRDRVCMKLIHNGVRPLCPATDSNGKTPPAKKARSVKKA